MSLEPLDLRYGPVIPPRRCELWEKQHFPRSLSRLNTATAASLNQMMDEISKGWEIGEVLTTDTRIIWVVDIAGQIWFANEELGVNGQPSGIPKKDKLEYTANADKLVSRFVIAVL